MKNSCFHCGFNFIAVSGRQSDSSSLVDSIRNTEDGYEGGSSDSGDECEWLKDLDFSKPKVGSDPHPSGHGIYIGAWHLHRG